MAVKLGLDCKFYSIVTANNASSFSLIEDIRDLTVTLEKGEADVTTRANGGWRAIQGALKEGTFEFELIVNDARANSQADFEVFRDAWLNNTNVEAAALTGLHNAVGTEGFRAYFSVLRMSQPQPLEDAVKYQFMMKPNLDAAAPQWMDVVA